MVLFEGIQTLKGFPRKFPIADDVPKQNWATKTDAEIVGETAAQQNAELAAALAALQTNISNILHNALTGIGTNDHHDKIHSGTHDGNGSDPLILPFEFKTNGNVVARLDTSGNLYIKGRVLKLP